MDSGNMKRLLARYLRYDLMCPVLGLEIASSLATSYNDGGSADILAVDKTGRLIEVEVKVSISDFRADRKKGKHEYYRKLCELSYNNKQRRFGQVITVEPKSYPTHKFYFAVPYEIANKVKLLCDTMYPYAGVLTNNKSRYGYPNDGYIVEQIMVTRKPKVLSPNKLTLLQVTRLAKGQSATIVRLLDEISIRKAIHVE